MAKMAEFTKQNTCFMSFPEVVICEADGEGEGMTILQAMPGFKSGGKGTQLGEVDTRVPSLGMAPDIF